MKRLKLTAIQIEIIELMLKQDILHTSFFVKSLFERNVYSKYYLWSNINELEEMGLIECVNNCKGHKKHKKLFTKDSLSDDFGVIFINSDTTKVNTERVENEKE